MTRTVEAAIRPLELGTVKALSEIRTRLDAVPQSTSYKVTRVHRQIAMCWRSSIRRAAGTAPAWLSVNFCEDGRLAEDWRLMIAQTAGLA